MVRLDVITTDEPCCSALDALKAYAAVTDPGQELLLSMALKRAFSEVQRYADVALLPGRYRVTAEDHPGIVNVYMGGKAVSAKDSLGLPVRPGPDSGLKRYRSGLLRRSSSVFDVGCVSVVAARTEESRVNRAVVRLLHLSACTQHSGVVGLVVVQILLRLRHYLKTCSLQTLVHGFLDLPCDLLQVGLQRPQSLDLHHSLASYRSD